MLLPRTYQCDYEQLELSCPSGTILNIKSADYGRKVIHISSPNNEHLRNNTASTQIKETIFLT